MKVFDCGLSRLGQMTVCTVNHSKRRQRDCCDYDCDVITIIIIIMIHNPVEFALPDSQAIRLRR